MLFEETEIVGKNKLGNTRVTGKEQFYTPPDSAKLIMSRAMKWLEADQKELFLEPAGGTGAFVEAALEVGFKKIVSLDIEPRHPKVQQGNFLSTQISFEGAICISNPPFGRNNSLSIPFFNRASTECNMIAFVVPRSWRKWSVINRLSPDFKLVDDWDLSIDYVDQKGEETHGVGNLRTCVQVWKRYPSMRRQKITIKDYGIIEKTTPEKADVSFTLFGYGCGSVKTEFERKKNTTQAYFKLNHPRALEALTSVDFSLFYNHTAYTEALGFQEINFLLNRYLGFESENYSIDPLDENYLGLSYFIQDDILGD